MYLTSLSDDSHYLLHIDRHHVLFLCRARRHSGGSPQDPCPSVNPSLRVGASLLQPLRPGLLPWRGRWVRADPLQRQIHGGLWEPKSHAALEAVPLIGGTVVYELWLLQRRRSGFSPSSDKRLFLLQMVKAESKLNSSYISRTNLSTCNRQKKNVQWFWSSYIPSRDHARFKLRSYHQKRTT